MKGSEKQIRWAKKLMVEKIDYVRQCFRAYANQAIITPDQVMDIFEQAAAKLVELHDDASWWIGHRDDDSAMREINAIADDIFKASATTEAEETKTTENTETTEAEETEEAHSMKLTKEGISMYNSEQTDWVKIFTADAAYDKEQEERSRAYYQGIVDEIDAQGGPKVKDLPKGGFPWRGDGKDHSQEKLYEAAKEWLETHPEN